MVSDPAPKNVASGGESVPCRIHVVDEASIVERGEQLRVWYVEEGQSFVKAHESPHAVKLEGEDDEVPPGIVWRRSTELVLPRGTLLFCRVTSPRIEVRDPLEYLTRGELGMHRATRETFFRVLGNYRLEPVAKPARGPKN